MSNFDKVIAKLGEIDRDVRRANNALILSWVAIVFGFIAAAWWFL